MGAIPPQRIVSMAPNITEIVSALGALHRLVGVTQFCDYPPEVKNIPKVGGLLNPNLERLITLKPDIVLLMKGRDDFLLRRFLSLGVPYLEVRTETLADILQAILQIGRAIGEEKKASELVRSINQNFTAHRIQNQGKPRKKIFWVLGRTSGSFRGMLTPASGTFMDEVIDAAGGWNIAHNYGKGYIQVPLETLLVENPDVIVETYPLPERKASSSWEKLQGEEIKEWGRWKEIKAVQTGELYKIYDDAVLRPSPRIQISLQIFEEILNGRQDNGNRS